MIVIPERETPGIRASPWATPIESRPDADVSRSRRCGVLSATQQDDGEHGEEDRDLPRLAEVRRRSRSRPAHPPAPRGSSRRRRPRRSARRRLSSIRRASEPNQAREQPDDVPPEVPDDRDERAEVERDVEGLVELVVLLEVRASRQATGRGSGGRTSEIGSSSVAPWTMPSTSACQFVSAPSSSPTRGSRSRTASAKVAPAVIVDGSSSAHRRGVLPYLGCGSSL